jgi:coniferyl-aldehyde dehydrogenase
LVLRLFFGVYSGNFKLNLGDTFTAGGPLASAFERQRTVRDSVVLASVGERRNRLERLARLLRENDAAICEAIDRDFGGRSPAETRLLEIFPSLEAISHARRHVAAWMRPRRARTGFWFMPGRSRVVPQPLGVVGIVVPWNYPVYLAVGPLVAAIAAGNRAMVKMSESAPATGALLATLVAERFDPAELVIVNGDADVAQAFTALPFDHLLFTGSTQIGRQVMRAAAANLTPVTLELGGKSPAIVGRGIPVTEAAARILFGKCLNGGQTCIAPDYVLVPRERVDAFVDAASATVARLYPRIRDNPDYTSIIDARHHARLQGYLEEAIARGARVVPINPAGESLGATRKIAPTLLIGVPEDARVMREEIFGPLLPIVAYDDLDGAIAYVNARPRPLALYVLDHDRAAIERVLARTVSGGVTVNETILHIAQQDLPFGGVGASGMGAYHGRAGFETFSKLKPVFYQPRLNGLWLLKPPYGKRFAFIAKWLMR